ncbi:MAG: CorA family divalent cation transporter [Candidatus Micrarchaeia archaeon]
MPLPSASDYNAFIEKRAFCVAQFKNGSVGMKSGLRASEFSSFIKNASVAWIDVAAADFDREAPIAAESMGFSKDLASRLLKKQISAYEDFNTEMGLLLPAVTVEGFKVKTNPLLILIKSNLVLTVHSAEVARLTRLRRYADTFMRKLPRRALHKDKVTQVLIRVIDENNGRNFDHLREIEEKGDRLSERLTDIKTPRTVLGPEIHSMKHALITYLSAMWATLDVINAMRYGDPELLTDNPKILHRLGALAADVNNNIGLAEHLSEVLASGLEVLQSIYNNQLQVLNNRLSLVVTYLTIIGTAVLVPNTIATALSSPVFGLTTKDAWWYLLLLIVSTIIATLFVYWWVKKKGWIPPAPE